MSMLHDLEKQLAEIQDEIEEYFRRLKEHANLEKSFQIAGNGLAQTNKNLTQLTKSTEITTKQLVKVINGFQESVDILKRSNPAQVIDAISKIEGQMNFSEKIIRESIDEIQASIDNFSNVQLKSAQKIEEVEQIFLDRQSRVAKKVKERVEISEISIRESIDQIQASIDSFEKTVVRRIEEIEQKNINSQSEITKQIGELRDKILDDQLKFEMKIKKEGKSIRTRIIAVAFMLGFLILFFELYI